MKKVFKKSKRLKHGHLLELAALCAAAMLLLAAALFISQGGMSKVNHLLAVNHITPSSQTAVNWGCVFGYACDNSSYQFVFYIRGNGYVNSTPNVSPGSQVALDWAANAIINGSNTGVCAPSKSGTGDCSITPTVGTFSPTGATGGTFYVYPSVTTTYTFYSQFASANGYGSTAVTVNVAAAATTCPVSSFSSPWNTNSYLIYSGGQGSISNWYGRYCVHNYSGNAIFIPMATAGEWNNFSSSAAGQNVGIVSY